MYCQVQIQLKSNSAEPSHFIEVQRILAESHISEQSYGYGVDKVGAPQQTRLLCINVNVSLSILLVSFYWPLHSPHLQACKDFQPVLKCNYHCGSYVLLRGCHSCWVGFKQSLSLYWRYPLPGSIRFYTTYNTGWAQQVTWSKAIPVTVYTVESLHVATECSTTDPEYSLGDKTKHH